MVKEDAVAAEFSGEVAAGGVAAAEPVPHVEAEAADGVVEAVADADGADEAGEPVRLDQLEALLFSTHHPLTAGRLAELLALDSTKPVRKAIRKLNADYEITGRCFRVEQVAGGFQLLTVPDHGPLIKQLQQREADAKLTKPALETLAIIAYKQPILRADIESIRGVACGETVRSLMEKHLVKIAGRAEVPGRPILYGTTRRFLELFGLNSLRDLPSSEDGLIRPPAVAAAVMPDAAGESAERMPDPAAADLPPTPRRSRKKAAVVAVVAAESEAAAPVEPPPASPDAQPE